MDNFLFHGIERFGLLQRYVITHDICKVKTLRGPVKTHCGAFLLADQWVFAYFCEEMKTLLRIAYWLAALALLAAILGSLDYTLDQALLIGLIFSPCALLLEILMPKARKPMDKVYLALAVLASVILLIIVLHYFAWSRIDPRNVYQSAKDVPPMLINPVFLALILTTLSYGDYFWAKWLDKRFKDENRTVTFFSDRKSVTLRRSEIAYVESNDTEVRIVTVSGESYRNKTGISQWENLLGSDFLRIHRSYLVNTARATLSTPDTVSVGDTELPVSRKYKETVSRILGDSPVGAGE